MHAPDDARRDIRNHDDDPLEAARDAFLKAKCAQGWTCRDGKWHHPTDPRKAIWIDPSSGEVRFSRNFLDAIDVDPDAVTYIDAVRQQIKRRRWRTKPWRYRPPSRAVTTSHRDT